VDLLREGYDTDAQFFSDDPAAPTTPIHWYKVPMDRPFLPFQSFITNSDWDNENGPRSDVFKGVRPGAQGEQWSERPFDRNRPPRPGEFYTGHFCGSQQQWAGDLRTDRPDDIGQYGCCIPGGLVQFDSVGSIDTCTASVLGHYSELATVGCQASFTAFPAEVANLVSCVCSITLASFVGSATGSFDVIAGTVDDFMTGEVTLTFLIGLCGSDDTVTIFDITHQNETSQVGTVDTGLFYPTGIYDLSSCACSENPFTVEIPAFFTSVAGSDDTGSFAMSIQSYGCATIVAAGSTQGTATNITTDHVAVTSTAANQGIILPAGCYLIAVRNNDLPLGSPSINIYPPVGGKIGIGATNAPLALTQGNKVLLLSTDGGVNWDRVALV